MAFTGPISSKTISGGGAGSRVEITKIGNWQKAAAGFKHLPAAAAEAAIWGQRKVAEKYVQIVKGHIDAQDLPWEPLVNPSLSGDPRILVDTEAFRSSIKSWRSGGVYHAGVAKGSVDHRGRSIADYASENEFGWGNVPKRALFAPSYDDMGGHAGMKAMMTASVYAKLQVLRANGLTVSI